MEPLQRSRLRSVLASQLTVYERMRDLMSLQREALVQNDSARLLQLMEEAGDLKSRAEDLQAEADPLRTQWEGAREAIPEGERQDLRVLMERIRAILAEVLADMNSLHDEVGSRRDATSERLRDLGRSVAGRRGYGLPPGGGHSKFLDRDG